MDEAQMYAYYDAKLKKYMTGGYGDIIEGGEDEDYVEKATANILDVTILDKETGLPWAYTETNHDEPDADPTPWAIFGDDDGEEVKVPHWDGESGNISESEYIKSLFFEGDGQLGKFYVAGSKFMIVRRSHDLDTIMAGLADDVPEECALIITGANGDYVCNAVQTNNVMIVMCYNKKKHEASAAKQALGNLMLNLCTAEGEADGEGLFYGGQWPYEADPVGGEEF